MNPFFQQIVDIYQKMPLSRKIIIASLLVFLSAGLMVMILVKSEPGNKPLFTNLAEDDAAAIVSKLKDMRVEYSLDQGGSAISVRAGKVLETRLSLAEVGLPKGGGVGFELFNETDFGVTDFVQKLNYQRALQGELARTIKAFDEVEEARVMIVMPKESVFIEEAKPPSASVLLVLKEGNSFPKTKVQAVVHLVSSSVLDLKPEQVTVVDAKGGVLTAEATAEEIIGNITTTQVQYKKSYEGTLTRRIQAMLEGVVGKGKALVVVSTDMDFDKVNIDEEVYDPDGQVARSRQTVNEQISKSTNRTGNVSSVNPIVPPATGGTSTGTGDACVKQNETVNFEVSRTIRRTEKPIATLTRLSVAAVIDGKYKYVMNEDGKAVKEYIARTEEEIEKFNSLVQKAMGYSADREDQISVESFPFESLLKLEKTTPPYDWKAMLKDYGALGGLIILVFVVYAFALRPIMKTVKEIQAPPDEPMLPAPIDEEEVLPGLEAKEEIQQIMDMTPREKSVYFAQQDIDKSVNILKGWLAEGL